MIKIKHPLQECNINQELVLLTCPPEDKRFHELLFTYGNITYRYHQHSKEYNPTIEDFEEWLEGLPENIKKAFNDIGFENCKTILPFTRHVLEKNDVGMEEYVSKHMGKEYEEYKNLIEISDTKN